MDARMAKQGAWVAAGGLTAGGALTFVAGPPGLAALLLAAGVCPISYIVLRDRRAGVDEVQAATQLMRATDRALYLHSFRAAAYSGAIACELGLGSKHTRRVHAAAMLHDIGKMAIERSLFMREGPLSPEEFEEVKRHAVAGGEILSECATTREFAPWVRHHHERVDGRGYPDGIGGDEIPLESRIIAVADAYDAMVGGAGEEDSHPYRIRRVRKEAMAELCSCAGKQFDGEVVRAFNSVMESKEAILGA